MFLILTINKRKKYALTSSFEILQLTAELAAAASELTPHL